MRFLSRPAFGLTIMCLAGLDLAGLPALAMDMPDGVATGDTAIGAVLVDVDGMTLYTFDEDSAGASACYGKCAENWPPLEAAADAPPIGDFVVISRYDGKVQWTYKGQPLYRWVRDKAPGDTTGDGVRGWHAATP
jgi:predicted lipoprotein with Yx(FWY)xxD motif